MPPLKKNTKADIHKSTFARTDCWTDFVNADKDTWSIMLREEHRLRVFKGTEEDTMPWEGQHNRGVEKLHNQKLYDLYSSPNIIWVVESRMRWTGHVARIGRGEVHTGFCSANLRERGQLLDREDNIKCDLQEAGRKARTRFIWLRIGTSAGLLRMW
jgi:hypothetical protein